MGGILAGIVFKKDYENVETKATCLWDIKADDIDGEEVLSRNIVAGKKCVMVVNVATQWGITLRDYRELRELWEEYGKQGFEILAFPCNQFGKSEPGSNTEIKEYAHKCMDAKFPMFSKVCVNGPNACEVFKFLRKRSRLYN